VSVLYFFSLQLNQLANPSQQRQKIYVQDLLRQHGESVYNALANKNGIVYICGSSGKMPQAIREALIEVFEKHGEMDRLDAEKYLLGMEKGGRYKQETW
jgi:sulfite reductase alpha subunit-like flavoprotein